MESYLDGENYILSVTWDELRLMVNSVNEALEVIDDWEFDTRLGAGREDARLLRTALADALQARDVSEG